ncbi:carboxypeptidase-like regulatory domain-containing protein [Lewinella sp. JB7]|uniref:carboxypeptidase-like regulatory domain-containing protein n=1 Tax=Lewinella sp. JB7 TaxID=2962887 RepID=UPI0020C9AA4C|nr:carboxypeptidase-like regulatory domain-containing protein [Lewinella sp. JB7]MCP9234866.1 carboxypeptidase-like regulatory domain-containing protein [Lewinella sp. JB7]
MKFLLILWLAVGGWSGCTQSATPRPPVVNDPTMQHSFEGRVVDAGGRPVPEVSVSIRDAPASIPDLATLTGDDGRFTLNNLPAGEYVLRLVPPTGGTRTAAVTVDGRAEVTDLRVGN